MKHIIENRRHNVTGKTGRMSKQLPDSLKGKRDTGN
jgi:hypothetical protein